MLLLVLFYINITFLSLILLFLLKIHRFLMLSCLILNKKAFFKLRFVKFINILAKYG